MLRPRRALAATIFLLFSSACAAPDKPAAPPPSVAELTALPPSCGRLTPPPPGGEVSFVVDGRAYVVSPTGARPHCVAEGLEAGPIQWSPMGDKLLVVGLDKEEVVREDGAITFVGPGVDSRVHGFSRPTGRYVLFTSADGRKLVKVSVTHGARRDISFLLHQGEIAYHPSGAEIAVTGSEQGRPLGIYLADNDGGDAKGVVTLTTEETFYGLTYSHDGSRLYFVADEHEDIWELHALDLSNSRAKDVKLSSAEAPITNLYVSLLSPNVIAYRQGDCDSAIKTFVRDEKEVREVAPGLGDTQPVGWLPDGTLVVAASDDLCDPQAALDLYIVNSDAASLLVRDVDEAAVRIVYPPPPPAPPGFTGGPPE